jgi:hypothetical protein
MWSATERMSALPSLILTVPVSRLLTDVKKAMAKMEVNTSSMR